MAVEMDERKWTEMFDSNWKETGNSFIQFLLDACLDVNARNKFGRTMLSYAAQWGNLEMVEFLVQKGADSNAKNTDGTKPLHFAAEYKRKVIVQYFLNTGVYVNSCDNKKCTPLHSVMFPAEDEGERYQDVVHVIHLLIDSGADLEFVNDDGMTPLLKAASYYSSYNQGYVELLISLGANLKNCEKSGWTVLHLAAMFGWTGTVRFIIEGRFDFNLDARTLSGETPMLIAAWKMREDIVEMFLKLGANVSYCNKDGLTVLHQSCIKGWLDIVKYLVKAGCDLNAKDSIGCTPLAEAVAYKRPSIAAYLIESGADLDFGGYKRELESTIMHYACEMGWLEVVKSLVKKGHNLDAQTSCGDTALHFAVAKNRIEFIKYLLEAGADCNKQNYYFAKTAFNACINLSNIKGVKLFIENGAFVDLHDYNAIFQNRWLKEAILRDPKLCTQAIINRFNNADLRRMYERFAWLPSLNLQIACNGDVAQDIAKSVQFEIETKGYCDLLEVRPNVLRMMCVRSFFEHLDNRPTVEMPTVEPLVVHLRKQAKVFMYACAKCDKRFALKCHLSHHVKLHKWINNKWQSNNKKYNLFKNSC